MKVAEADSDDEGGADAADELEDDEDDLGDADAEYIESLENGVCVCVIILCWVELFTRFLNHE